MDKVATTTEKPKDTKRREFLKKSAYAAYATPALTMLVVGKAGAKPNCSVSPSNSWHCRG